MVVRSDVLRSTLLRKPARRTVGVGRRRLVLGMLLAALALPGLTAVLNFAHGRLELVDELLLYLLVVVLVTLVGGLWPSVLAALAAGLLLNWYFTPPLHTWNVDAPTNVLALCLFIATAVTVSAVVHRAARAGALAAARAAEADVLLGLARTVLAGDDSPQAVLDHLHDTLGLAARLEERADDGWILLASAGASDGGATTVLPAGATLRLVVQVEPGAVGDRVLDGFAAQAAAARVRHRLRIQAEQSEALSAANRMRTALLAAVSHDLRTPLASVKASVSTLRQHDITWTDADRDALLATIEDGADRLTALIANLLDMSRIHTGAVEPFIRSVALDEIVPLAARGLDGAAHLIVDVPEDLPLVCADPVLLERVLANLFANALRYSPPARPPSVRAECVDGPSTVAISVIDHGEGVPAADRERIFEPFQQLGDRRPAGGVGLGLAVAKGFAEAMGARLSVLDTDGGGLTMRVDVPVSRAARHPARSRP
ncbi:MAG TPA: ATP-binding protein [Jatrophihabitantaceae bacterium]|nr:ATP-binding protein [Jatrophihabitantaceae bacterium]